MSIFNIAIDADSAPYNTRILVTPTRDGRQLTIYQNRIPAYSSDQKREKYAFFIPLPLAAGAEMKLIELTSDDLFNKIDKHTHASNLTDASSGKYKVTTVRDLSALRKLENFIIDPVTENLLAKSYGERFGFLVCTFRQRRGENPHAIAVVHDLLPNGELFIPLYQHHGSETVTQVHYRIYSINVAANHGAGLVCPKKEKLSRIFDAAGLHFILPRNITLRRLDLIGERENEDLALAIDPQTISLNNVYVVVMGLNAVAIERTLEAAEVWPSRSIVHHLLEDLAPVMYVMMSKFGSGSETIWGMSDDIEHLLHQFTDGVLGDSSKAADKGLRLQLVDGMVIMASWYKLSIVVIDEQ